MADIKTAYASPASITCTVNSLAAAAARESTAVDNTTNKYLDAAVRCDLKLATGTPGTDKAIYIWFYGSEDGTNYGDNATGSDAALTMRVPTNLRGPFVINTPDSGALTYKGYIPSVASFFGGILPKKWGLVVENKTNVGLDSSGNTIEYSGVYATN